MKTYCVKQRKQTECVEPSGYKYAKNGRLMFFCTCAECGITKTRFVKQSEVSGSGVDIHKMIGKLPKPKAGWTLPGHKYTGPYNDLENQVRWNPKTGEILEIYQQPTGKTDAIAMQHDVDYSVCKDDKKCKGKADRKMVKELDAIPYNERQWGHALARNVINTKQKLGLGVPKKSRGKKN